MERILRRNEPIWNREFHWLGSASRKTGDVSSGAIWQSSCRANWLPRIMCVVLLFLCSSFIFTHDKEDVCDGR